MVTSFAQAAADNFGSGGVIPHDDRYRRAGEALDVVKELWDSWEDATVVEDRERGIYNDLSRIHVPEPWRVLRRRGAAGSRRRASRHLPGRRVGHRPGLTTSGLLLSVDRSWRPW
ncbi:hypothetical protein Psuf_005260 [Phytohabitans suffuscus]|uniref:Uncharacterized protein n=1 Tax=Phytohabitans suffuscus TaxID=624315 RepID=A0A6F8YB12_9ACTN|nr:hypothetical protein Psuf_005260 [Phytohabitans suffuscus]